MRGGKGALGIQTGLSRIQGLSRSWGSALRAFTSLFVGTFELDVIALCTLKYFTARNVGSAVLVRSAVVAAEQSTGADRPLAYSPALVRSDVVRSRHCPDTPSGHCSS